MDEFGQDPPKSIVRYHHQFRPDAL